MADLQINIQSPRDMTGDPGAFCAMILVLCFLRLNEIMGILDRETPLYLLSYNTDNLPTETSIVQVRNR